RKCTPNLFAGTLVIGCDGAADAILATSVSGDDKVFGECWWRGDGRAFVVVHDLGLPQLLAGFSIERNEVAVKPPDEQLVIGKGNTAIVQPTASGLLNIRRNLWRIFPFRCSVLCIDRIHVLRAS